ncbi:MAG: hypothetical protein ACR2J8_07200 [Thermomicrobiales bacterium]
MPKTPATDKPSELGVFASIAAGCSLLIAQPLPMIVPVLVDVWLWQGPRVSPASVAGPLADALAIQPGGDTGLADVVLRWGQSGDITAIVGWFAPSLLAGLDVVPMTGLRPRPAIEMGGPGAMLLALLMIVLAAFVVMIFKTMLARGVQGRPLLDRAFPAEALRNGVRYLAYLVLATVAIAVAVVPVAVLLALAGVMGANLLPLFGLVASMAVFAGAVLLAFVGEAIALTGAGPWQAVKLSAGVVRDHSSRTMGLLLVLWVSLVSLPEVLARLGSNRLGIALAILIYAFAATGLEFGRMLFFHARLPRTSMVKSSPLSAK